MFCFWLLLSGYFDWFHLLMGALSSLLVSYLSHDLLMGGMHSIVLPVRRLLRFIAYLPWLFFQIIKANLDVAYITLHPRLPIDPCVVNFESKTKIDYGITTLANSITLTPGTVTIDANSEGDFTVHAINREAAESVLSGEMTRRVKKIWGSDV